MPLGERRNRSLLVLAAGLVLAGELAACTNGEGAEPDPAETLTSIAPTGDPSGEPTADRPEVEKPVPPDAMARDDVAGAEAAAQYFLELYTYAFISGDLSTWTEMAHPECAFCTGVAEDVNALHEDGGSLHGGAMTLRSVEGRPPLDGNDYFRVDIELMQAPSTQTAGDGAITENDGGENHLIFAVGRTESGWQIREVQIEDAGWDG